MNMPGSTAISLPTWTARTAMPLGFYVSARLGEVTLAGKTLPPSLKSPSNCAAVPKILKLQVGFERRSALLQNPGNWIPASERVHMMILSSPARASEFVRVGAFVE